MEGTKFNIVESAMYTGFPTLDSEIGGFERGELVIITGETGCGKSALLHNIFTNALTEQCEECMLFSSEMPKRVVANRILACISDLEFEKVTGRMKLTDLENERFESEVQEYNMYSLMAHISESVDMTVPKIKAEILEQKCPTNILVDGMHMILPSTGYNSFADAERYQTARELKNLAMEQKAVVIATMPYAADKSNDSSHRLSNLKGVESIADVVLSIKHFGEEDTRINILKNRHGKEGHVDIEYQADRFRFYEHVFQPGELQPSRMNDDYESFSF